MVSVSPDVDREGIVKVVEAVGAGIMVIGGLGSLVVFASRARHAHMAQGSYDELRRNLGRCILLGLEVLIVADIVRTIIVDPTSRESRSLAASSLSGSSSASRSRSR